MRLLLLALALLLASCVTVRIEVHTDCDEVTAEVEAPDMSGMLETSD